MLLNAGEAARPAGADGTGAYSQIPPNGRCFQGRDAVIFEIDEGRMPSGADRGSSDEAGFSSSIGLALKAVPEHRSYMTTGSRTHD